ncbi:hypothetical protein AKJ09_02442 [Labilithrix luteola]|uniref:Uncharacterized protein n=1 Tax=Labilithrix luteola TaxID=1391654 RepID=A0A0K1PQH9_9BACT|nr:hypothetical protein AKJ09_02442 [Labilithrix luteola]
MLGLGACSAFGGEDGEPEISAADAGGSDVATGETSSPVDASVEAEASPCDLALLKTDKLNCGACGHRCETSCNDGMCEPLPMGASLNLPLDAHFVVDDRAIFVSDKFNVYQCDNPSFGESCNWNNVTNNDTSSLVAPSPMALSPKRLFWSAAGSALGSPSSLWSRPREGVMIAGTQSDAPAAFALGTNGGATTVVLIDSTNARTVYTITCDDKTCGYPASIGQSGRAVAGSGSRVCYLGTFGQGAFGLMCNPGSSAGPLIVKVDQDSVGLTVGGDAVFVVSPEGVSTLPQSAATLQQLGKVGGTGPIAADANNIYFASLYTIYRCSRTDCSAPTKISDRFGKTVMELGVGGDYVYFLESDGTPSLLRIPK